MLDKRTRVLILGSFPSAVSLQAGQYYAHKQNQFWKILSVILARPLLEMPYAERWAPLLTAGIGVWDVYASCEREGSLDSEIRQAVENDFSQLKQIAPALAQICFNGKTAARLQRKFAQMGYAVKSLPSTSPAYTLSFEAKCAAWQSGLSMEMVTS